jgi:hypothetical protein
MAELHQALASRVAAWRAAGYPHDATPAIAEILGHAVEGEDPAAPFPQSGQLRFLRAAQLRALETYWYLRLVEGTPRIGDLYERAFPVKTDRLDALGLTASVFKDLVVNEGYEGLIDRIGTDDAFVKQHRLDALRAEGRRRRHPGSMVLDGSLAGR